MHPVVFEPAIPASERPQTHALDSAAIGIGSYLISYVQTSQAKSQSVTGDEYLGNSDVDKSHI